MTLRLRSVVSFVASAFFQHLVEELSTRCLETETSDSHVPYSCSRIAEHVPVLDVSILAG